MAEHVRVLLDETQAWEERWAARRRRTSRYLWSGAGCLLLTSFGFSMAVATTVRNHHALRTATDATLILSIGCVLALVACVLCFTRLLRPPAALR